jgi:Tol biopolymer transport system component
MSRNQFLLCLIVLGVTFRVAAQSAPADVRLGTALRLEDLEGDCSAALPIYEQLAADGRAPKDIAARARLHMGTCKERLGRPADAQLEYQAVLSRFADQTQIAAIARTRVEAFGRNGNSIGTTLHQICSGECQGTQISPDGRYLAFGRDDGWFVRDLSSGSERKVLSVPSCCPVFSPNSKRIAFGMTDPGGDQRGTSVVNVDGSDPRNVADRGFPLAWSPDGARLLLGTGQAGRPFPTGVRKEPTGLLWVRIADGSAQALPTLKLNLDAARVSPDGKHMAFTARPDRDSNENIYVMRSDGADENRLAPSPTHQDPSGWSPDGRFFIYKQSVTPQTTTVWSIPLSDGRAQGPPVVLKQFDSNVYVLGMSRSGVLYYRVLAGSGDLYTASMDPVSGRVTSSAVALPVGTVGNGPAAWSRDAQRLAYMASGQTNRELHVFSFKDGKERRVPSAVPYQNSLCWAPTADAILTNAARRGVGLEIVRVDVSSGDTQPMFPTAPIFRIWSCTDTLASSNETSSVKVRNLQTGAETEIYRIKHPTNNYGMSRLSPDGRSVAFFESLDPDVSVLVTVPSAGGPARELARVKRPAQLQTVDGFEWSADSRFVYFFKRATSQSKYELFRVSTAGGQEERMGLEGFELRGPHISPDGKRIAFIIGAFQRPEIWAMEHFLPAAK